jgi:redox-sensitive bicupin YhaK (pirin superfamily)
MLRHVENQVQGFRTSDGAGVSLVRVLGHDTVGTFDPFLMLDAFDSTNPDDYMAGFPMHPHRGIETVMFLSKGSIVHEDHLGNKATIHDGEAQWLTAGSGAFHSEMPEAAERMLGVQLWLNLPAHDKMTADPAFREILKDDIQEFALDAGTLRLIAGTYEGHSGVQGKYLPLDYFDIHLDAGGTLELSVPSDNKSAMVFTLEGDAIVSGTPVAAKTAAKLGDGDTVTIQAGDEPIEILFMCSERLDEPVEWYGPIVMNTHQEILDALDEIDLGTFVKKQTEYEGGEETGANA